MVYFFEMFLYYILTSSLNPASRVRLHEQTPEPSLGAEVYHQASLVIDAHAGWIQGTWRKTHTKGDYRQSAFGNEIDGVQTLKLGALPCSSACGGLPMPSFQRMAVSYTKVRRSSDCRSKCCQPPVPTGEWNT